MKHKLKTILSAMLLFAAFLSFNSYASTLEQIVAKDPNLSITNQGCIRVQGTKVRTVCNEADLYILNATRNCSAEISEGIEYYDDAKAYFTKKDTDRIVELTIKAEEWTKENVPKFIPDGLSRDEAIKAAFMYLSDNYEYSYDLRFGNESDIRKAANASYLFENGKGVCVAFSCAFRAIVEAIPFKDGVVKWSAENPEHIQVAIVKDNSHMWNAIKEDDGRWLYYDTASAADFKQTEPYFRALGGTLYDNNGPKVWSY